MANCITAIHSSSSPAIRKALAIVYVSFVYADSPPAGKRTRLNL
jgi:hypothetical protein